MTIFSQFEARPDNYNKTGEKKKVLRQQVRSLNHSFLFPFLVTFYKWNHREITRIKSQGDIANVARKEYIFSILTKYSFLLRLILFNFFFNLTCNLAQECKPLKQKIQFGPIVFDNYNGDLIVLKTSTSTLIVHFT